MTQRTATSTLLPMPWLGAADPLLVGLVGRAGSGKTSAAAYLESAYDMQPYAWAEPIKDVLALLFADRGVDHALLEEPHLKEVPIPQFYGLTSRQLMRRQGDLGRAMHPDCWVDQGAHRLGLAAASRADWQPVHDRLCISDVRYPNEAQWIIDHGGVLIRLLREPASAAAITHSSEAHADDLAVHAEIDNYSNNLATLRGQLDYVMYSLGTSKRDRWWHCEAATVTRLETE
jgi:hypothetical protein